MTTTQKAPVAITLINELTYHINSDTMNHGYCTIVYSKRNVPLYDVYCQIEGDEVRIGRDLKERAACTLINDANAKSHNGKEV